MCTKSKEMVDVNETYTTVNNSTCFIVQFESTSVSQGQTSFYRVTASCSREQPLKQAGPHELLIFFEDAISNHMHPVQHNFLRFPKEQSVLHPFKIHFLSYIYGGSCIWETEDFCEFQTILGYRMKPCCKECWRRENKYLLVQVLKCQKEFLKFFFRIFPIINYNMFVFISQQPEFLKTSECLNLKSNQNPGMLVGVNPVFRG